SLYYCTDTSVVFQLPCSPCLCFNILFNSPSVCLLPHHFGINLLHSLLMLLLCNRSVMLWGCFGGERSGDLVQVKGILKEESYHSILQRHAIPSGL
ncbi:hypothetical protein LDENG_00100410, partial [Lucifuga dentata]